MTYDVRFTQTKPLQSSVNGQRPCTHGWSREFELVSRDATGFSRDVCAILSVLAFSRRHLVPDHLLFTQVAGQHHPMLLLAGVRFFWRDLSADRSLHGYRNHFELALLIQSVLMILAQVRTLHPNLLRSIFNPTQLALLYICIRYRPTISPENFGTSTRPFSFWQWSTYTQYIEFLAGFMYVFPCTA